LKEIELRSLGKPIKARVFHKADQGCDIKDNHALCSSVSDLMYDDLLCFIAKK